MTIDYIDLYSIWNKPDMFKLVLDDCPKTCFYGKKNQYSHHDHMDLSENKVPQNLVFSSSQLLKWLSGGYTPFSATQNHVHFTRNA